MSGAIEELYAANDAGGLSPHAGMRVLSDAFGVSDAVAAGAPVTARAHPSEPAPSHPHSRSVAESLPNGATGPELAPSKPVVSGPAPGLPPVLVVVERGREDEVRIGPMLRQRREQAGISLDQASERTRIPRVHLEALEDMNIKAIPQGFGTGYAKAYAEFLGLQPDMVVNRLRSESGLLAFAREVTPEARSAKGNKGAPVQALLAVAAILGVAGFVGWSLIVDDGATKDGNAVIVDAPAAPKIAAAGTDYSRRALEIEVLRPAFLEARGPDGVVYLARVMRPGETLTPQLGAGWRLSAPDGGAFGVRVDELPPVPLGADGMAVIGWRVDDALDTSPPVEETTAAAETGGAPTIAPTPVLVQN